MARTADKPKTGSKTPSGVLKMTFDPAPGYILLQPLKADTKTETGIYLPDSATEKPQTGNVIAVGDDEITDHGVKRKSPVKVGDKVIYKKWGGNEVSFHGVEYLFVRFEDILAVER